MGMRMPETCWAVFKRQVINLWNCCIWLVDSFECMMIHGLASPKFTGNSIQLLLCKTACLQSAFLHYHHSFFEKWMPLFLIKSRFPKRGIKRRSMKVARKVAVAFCVSSLLSPCSALQEILQSSLRIPHHFIKTWLEGAGGGWGEDRLIHMWFEVFFFDNLTKVFKKEKAALRNLCGGRGIIQCRRNGWVLGTVWQCDQ